MGTRVLVLTDKYSFAGIEILPLARSRPGFQVIFGAGPKPWSMTKVMVSRGFYEVSWPSSGKDVGEVGPRSFVRDSPDHRSWLCGWRGYIRGNNRRSCGGYTIRVVRKQSRMDCDYSCHSAVEDCRIYWESQFINSVDFPNTASSCSAWFHLKRKIILYHWSSGV